MKKTLSAVVTPANSGKMEFATLFTVTYPGRKEMDRDVPWSYVRELERQGYRISCRNGDGSPA